VFRLRCPHCGAVRQSNFSTCSKCGKEIVVFFNSGLEEEPEG